MEHIVRPESDGEIVERRRLADEVDSATITAIIVGPLVLENADTIVVTFRVIPATDPTGSTTIYHYDDQPVRLSAAYRYESA